MANAEILATTLGTENTYGTVAGRTPAGPFSYARITTDDRNGLIQGGNRGPAIVPGSPEKSLLIEAVRHTHAKVKMPPEKHLAEEEIADLVQWIKDGAAWPRPQLPASLGKYKAKYAQLKKEHWAWQPIAEPAVPAVADAAWPRDELDRFILARLEAAGLKPDTGEAAH